MRINLIRFSILISAIGVILYSFSLISKTEEFKNPIWLLGAVPITCGVIAIGHLIVSAYRRERWTLTWHGWDVLLATAFHTVRYIYDDMLGTALRLMFDKFDDWTVYIGAWGSFLIWYRLNHPNTPFDWHSMLPYFLGTMGGVISIRFLVRSLFK